MMGSKSALPPNSDYYLNPISNGEDISPGGDISPAYQVYSTPLPHPVSVGGDKSPPSPVYASPIPDNYTNIHMVELIGSPKVPHTLPRTGPPKVPQKLPRTGSQKAPENVPRTASPEVPQKRPGTLMFSRDKFDSGVADLDKSDLTLRSEADVIDDEYEYGDPTRQSHFYEDVPHDTSRVPPPHKGSQVNISLSSIPVSTVTSSHWGSSDAGDTTHIIPEPRKRHNPLYEAVNHTYPDRTGKSYHQASHRHMSCYICCLVVFSIITLLVSLGALGLTLYINFDVRLVKDHQRTDASKLISLEQEYETLKQNFTDVTNSLTEISASLKFGANGENATIAQKLTQNRIQIESLDGMIAEHLGVIESLQSQIANMSEDLVTLRLDVDGSAMETQSHIQNISVWRTDVETQLTNISKSPGPAGVQGEQGLQGEPGVGNLTGCSYQTATEIYYGGGEPEATVSLPSLQDLQDLIVISVSCDVSGGTTHKVERRGDNPEQFRCVCSGTQQGSNSRTCTIHMWLCPRIS